jgi:hypothetical protein
MANFERIRDVVSGPFSESLMQQRTAAGWQLVSIESRERMVLTQMMDLVVQDFPFSSIASDLNEKGFRTREGKLWNQVSVFQMIPRLIEIGPGLFSTAEWAVRRERMKRPAVR